MSTNNSNIRINGGRATAIYLAPKGATLPTGLTDPIGDFEHMGWLHEDGIEFEVSTDSNKIKAMQGGATVRVAITSTEKTLKFTCLEDKPGVSELYWDHGKPTLVGAEGSQVARVDLPESIGLVERTAVVRLDDGDITKFVCLELIQITERESLSNNSSDPAAYGFTAEIIGDSYFLTNAPAFIEAAA
ncbi:hypothetical protein Leucomu_03630 [Leucobacter muris]|uniref:Phage tail protein n=1 Tax=Leucobacter muris TaxID=1935379 RepID=A0ABX5QDN1_9MICO|nr:hypothetical protein [Leucobacter muris]QAB17133.1 hypothetical protein Leucomu_03630 [Leucobacter muris]